MSTRAYLRRGQSPRVPSPPPIGQLDAALPLILAAVSVVALVVIMASMLGGAL
jgi:hypothetical protein